MAEAKKKKAVKSAPVGAGDGDLATVDLSGGPVLVERYRPGAAALRAGEVREFHGSARLMARNCAVGAASVVSASARARIELPALDLSRVAALPDLAVATAWAAEEVVRFSDTKGEDVGRLLQEAAALRSVLLTNLDGAVKAGLVPVGPVQKIHVGRGGFDTAGDCVASAGLYKKYAAALKGKTPVTAAQVREAAALGAKLLTILRPKGGKRSKAAELKAAIDLRDRLSTLLARDYDAVRRAGAWLFGEARDEATPLLLANAGRSKKRAAKTPPVI